MTAIVWSFLNAINMRTQSGRDGHGMIVGRVFSSLDRDRFGDWSQGWIRVMQCCSEDVRQRRKQSAYGLQRVSRQLDMLKGGVLALSLEGTSTRRFLRDIARSRHHTPSQLCARRQFCSGSQHNYYEMEKAANAHFGPLVYGVVSVQKYRAGITAPRFATVHIMQEAL